MICSSIFLAIVGGPIAAKVTGHPNTTAYTDTMEDEFGIPQGPNNDFWFGADGTGRDLFVRTMYGARTSLLVGVVASGIAVVDRPRRRPARRLLRRLERHDPLAQRRRDARAARSC